MTTNRTALEILEELHAAGCIRGENQWSGDMGTLVYPEAASESLLADILSLDVMQDEETVKVTVDKSLIFPTTTNIRDDAEAKLRNKLREKLRFALQDYFMGGDVGADSSKSEEVSK